MGLCGSLPNKMVYKYKLVYAGVYEYNELFQMIKPEFDSLDLRWVSFTYAMYWGYGENLPNAHIDSIKYDYEIRCKLTPMRQTILILLAILNGEKV
jgi:hypothetical protein